MSSSTGTSPDPITLESSPPSARTAGVDRIPPPKAARQRKHASPSRSFILDPGTGRGQSPWRIHVTVEPAGDDMTSPDDSFRRSTKVPLYDSQLSSPAKRRYRKTPGLEESVEVKRPSRKSRLKAVPELPIEKSPSSANGARPSSLAAPYDWSSAVGASPQKAHSEPPFTNVTQRSKRLSRARQELGDALHEATAREEHYRLSKQYTGVGQSSPLKEVPGDLTVSLNEDFTMVSVDSLQSYKNRTHGLLHRDNGERPLEVNAHLEPKLQSAEPGREDDEVHYPDLTAAASFAEPVATAPNHLDTTFDTSSRKPIGADDTSQVEVNNRSSPSREIRPAHEPTEWQLEREAVSRQIRDANASQVIVINDTTVPPESIAGDGMGDDDDGDIWQEEASRSMEEASFSQRSSRKRPIEQSPPSKKERSPQLADFFADEPILPRRSKIPRTWRQNSGMDFAYSDSPEHPKQAFETATEPQLSPLKRPGNSDGESGVLTPPTTDDEHAKLGESAHQHDASDLTEPDAAATQLEGAKLATLDDPDARRTDARLPFIAESRASTSYTRPPQYSRRAADLSDILQPESSPPKIPHDQEDSTGRRGSENYRGSDYTQPATYQLKNNIEFEPFIPKLSPQRPLNQYSPFRRSLFRPSNIRGSPVRSRRDSTNYFIDDISEASGSRPTRSAPEVAVKGSFEAGATTQHDLSQETDPPQYEDMSDGSQSVEFTEAMNDASRSYEEHLNMESPLKVKVNFNESLRQSALLAARKTYPPLFRPPASLKDTRIPPLDGHVETLTSASSQTRGLLSRITSSLWATLIRPSGPSTIPGPHSVKEPEFSPTLRARIRSRYGVVSSIHTWNMVHMRTLHRMVNSITSGKADSIIPASGPLPSYLAQLLGSRQVSVAGFEYLFDMQNAQIVFAFLQILVDPSLVAAMETGEIAFLGDASARRFRDTDVLGRRGQDSPWPYHKYKIVVPSEGTRIDWAFVVRALGDALFAHEWEIKRHGRNATTSVS